MDPDATIACYVRHFPTSSKTTWAGLPALAAPNDVLVLFTRVAAPAPTTPQSAIWHFGWHVPDTQASRMVFGARPDLELLPLYTTDEGGSVFVSSDTWPSRGPTPGLTKAQIAEARAAGVQPTRAGGFGYARAAHRPRRAQRGRSRRLGREAPRGGRPVPGGALPPR